MPLEYSSASPDIRGFLARVMKSAAVPLEIPRPDQSVIIDLMSGGPLASASREDLTQFIMELLSEQSVYRARTRDTILKLVEEKYSALHQTQLLEQTLGLVQNKSKAGFGDSEFMEKIEYWQQENEKQTATISSLKVRIVSRAQSDRFK